MFDKETLTKSSSTDFGSYKILASLRKYIAISKVEDLIEGYNFKDEIERQYKKTKKELDKINSIISQCAVDTEV